MNPPLLKFIQNVIPLLSENRHTFWEKTLKSILPQEQIALAQTLQKYNHPHHAIARSLLPSRRTILWVLDNPDQTFSLLPFKGNAISLRDIHILPITPTTKTTKLLKTLYDIQKNIPPHKRVLIILDQIHNLPDKDRLHLQELIGNREIPPLPPFTKKTTTLSPSISLHTTLSLTDLREHRILDTSFFSRCLIKRWPQLSLSPFFQNRNILQDLIDSSRNFSASIEKSSSSTTLIISGTYRQKPIHTRYPFAPIRWRSLTQDWEEISHQKSKMSLSSEDTHALFARNGIVLTQTTLKIWFALTLSLYANHNFVIVEGPHAIGKTWSITKFAHLSHHYISNYKHIFPNVDFESLELHTPFCNLILCLSESNTNSLHDNFFWLSHLSWLSSLMATPLIIPKDNVYHLEEDYDDPNTEDFPFLYIEEKENHSPEAKFRTSILTPS